MFGKVRFSVIKVFSFPNHRFGGGRKVEVLHKGSVDGFIKSIVEFKDRCSG